MSAATTHTTSAATAEIIRRARVLRAGVGVALVEAVSPGGAPS